jgi:hypothetical protein
MSKQSVKWVPTPAWFSEEHEISSDGRIRRAVDAARGKGQRGGAQWKAGHELRQQVDDKGYARVSYRNGTASVHRLVCEAFNGPAPFPGAMVLHLDDVKTNNTPKNLRWGTMQENAADARRNGRVASVPLRFDRDEARRLRDSGMTFRQVGAALGVSHVAVMNGLKAA